MNTYIETLKANVRAIEADHCNACNAVACNACAYGIEIDKADAAIAAAITYYHKTLGKNCPECPRINRCNLNHNGDCANSNPEPPTDWDTECEKFDAAHAFDTMFAGTAPANLPTL
jgi:hypothetical protein